MYKVIEGFVSAINADKFFKKKSIPIQVIKPTIFNKLILNNPLDKRPMTN